MPVQTNEKFVAVSCGNNHTLALSSNFQVFSFGSNDFGQLGIPKPSSMLNRVPIDERVVAVICGHDHSAALTDNGAVYTWGCGTSGQLGLSHSQNENLPQKLSSVTDKIVKIACGYMHTTCLSENGDLYIFGFIHNDLKFGNSGKKVRSFPLSDPVVSLATGSTHILVLTASGAVYCMGVNGHGQLALDDKIVLQMQELYPLKGKKVIQLAAGFQHTVALTSTGQVYAFGRNERGQLGVGHSKLQPTPSVVNIPGVKRIIDIFHLSQQAPLSDVSGIIEEHVVELPLPATHYHENFNLQFQSGVIEQEDVDLPPLPQSFSIVGNKPRK